MCIKYAIFSICDMMYTTIDTTTRASATRSFHSHNAHNQSLDSTHIQMNKVKKKVTSVESLGFP